MGKNHTDWVERSPTTVVTMEQNVTKAMGEMVNQLEGVERLTYDIVSRSHWHSLSICFAQLLQWNLPIAEMTG